MIIFDRAGPFRRNQGLDPANRLLVRKRPVNRLVFFFVRAVETDLDLVQPAGDYLLRKFRRDNRSVADGERGTIQLFFDSPNIVAKVLVQQRLAVPLNRELLDLATVELLQNPLERSRSMNPLGRERSSRGHIVQWALQAFVFSRRIWVGKGVGGWTCTASHCCGVGRSAARRRDAARSETELMTAFGVRETKA